VRHRDWPVLFGQTHPFNKGPEFSVGELLQPVEVAKLRFRSRLGFVRPEAPIGLPMLDDRSADGIAKLAIFEPVLTLEEK